MNLFQNIEKLNGSQRWVLVLGMLVLASVFFFVTLQQGLQPFFTFWMFLVPLSLSAVLLGFNVTAGMTILVFFLSCLGLSGPQSEIGNWLVFVLALAINFVLWSRWRR